MRSTEIPDPTSKEPAISVGTITSIAAALITALVAFGLPISDTQQDAILGLIAIAAPLVAAWFIRNRVYAPATVAQMIDEASGEPGPGESRHRWPGNLGGSR